MIGSAKRTKFPTQSRAVDSSLFPRVTFYDGLTAFEHACDGECVLREGIMLPALILDACELFGAASAVEIQDDGRQMASIRVASADGGFIVSASTCGALGPKLRPGQFVAWQAERYDPKGAKEAPAAQKRFGLFGLKDKRIGWIGQIAGTLKPEYWDGGWIGDERFSS
jgi:hypothetical protein